MEELRVLPQIIGVDEVATRKRAEELFHQLTSSTVMVSSLEAAEIIKLVDNTYRDVQFGFANEVARICDAVGVNAMEVIQGGKLGYARTDVALPGLVGGPCLEKDPHILAQSAKLYGIKLGITTAARAVNEGQPTETVDFILKEYNRRRAGVDPKIAVLGIAFKGVPATDDLRGSMSLHVLDALIAQIPACELCPYDPVCTDEQLREINPAARIAGSVMDAVTSANIVIIANNHPELAKIRPEKLISWMAKDGFIYDYWNHFSDLVSRDAANVYYAVGNTGAHK